MAVDTSTFVWAWGINTYGQLGDCGQYDHVYPYAQPSWRKTPVEVKDGEMLNVDRLTNIVQVSSGSSRAHSLKLINQVAIEHLASWFCVGPAGP